MKILVTALVLLAVLLFTAVVCLVIVVFRCALVFCWVWELFFGPLTDTRSEDMAHG